jgi:hypothetical protein
MIENDKDGREFAPVPGMTANGGVGTDAGGRDACPKKKSLVPVSGLGDWALRTVRS